MVSIILKTAGPVNILENNRLAGRIIGYRSHLDQARPVTQAVILNCLRQWTAWIPALMCILLTNQR